MKILSIDAWGNEVDGYEWSAWYIVGNITKEEFESLDTDKKILAYMRKEGYLTTGNRRYAYIEDDQYNIVIFDRANDRPLFAIEYGPEY
jgi:hypothetical protein